MVKGRKESRRLGKSIKLSRIRTPPTIEATPEASRRLLEAVKTRLGVVPNIFRLVANSPATLEGYLGLQGALTKGSLDLATRERIGLAIAQFDGCSYCLSAHAYIGKTSAKLDEAEIMANRHGISNDPKANAAVEFAIKLVRERGHVSASDVELVRKAGYSDGEIIEIIGHVAVNTFTNYVNEALCTAIDFPIVRPD